MQVLTLTPDAFADKCDSLAHIVAERHPVPFDATVSILTGGGPVSDAMASSLPPGYLGERHEVSIQRPSTKKKDGFIGRILPRLPIQLLNLMRMAESIALDLRHRLSADSPLPEVALGNELAAILSERRRPRILIIDDAVDSGTTLAAVRDSILKANPGTEVTSAVLTVTTSRPLQRPDFSLYSNRTLIRFPWSKDFPR